MIVTDQLIISLDLSENDQSMTGTDQLVMEEQILLENGDDLDMET